MKIFLENQTNYKINLKMLNQISLEVTNKDVELIICNNSYIQKLNLKFRNKDIPTDVLSFPFENMPNAPLGIIVISVDFINEKSKELNHSFDEELALLFIHGLLHLVGYDHEKDNGEHRSKEEEIIKQFNLPSSLIVRSNIFY
jgi:probable rRNA maturation factor